MARVCETWYSEVILGAVELWITSDAWCWRNEFASRIPRKVG